MTINKGIIKASTFVLDGTDYSKYDWITENDETKKISIPIQWKWEYETGNDEGLRETEDREDTEDGKMLQNYNFDIIVTGTQVLPNA